MKLADLIPRSLLGGGQDAVSLLEADHDKLIAMFERFEQLKSGRSEEKEALVAVACHELTIHTSLEEEVFYPAVREAIEADDLMNAALVEHDGAKSLIHELDGMNSGDDMFNATFSVLARHVKQHIKEERDQIFHMARDADIDLEALAKKMVARREELLKGNGKSTHRHGPVKRKHKPRAAKAEIRKTGH